MRADIVTGAVFPDYELTDHAGKRRRLSELQGPDPMILVLSRGGYCPKDLRQAEGLVHLYREMEVGYARLVTIARQKNSRVKKIEDVREVVASQCFCTLYSERRATIGSTVAARQAGIAHAARAIPPTSTVATPL